jgi:hypothetical protein
MELRIENEASGLGLCALKMGPRQRIGRVASYRAMVLVWRGGQGDVNRGTLGTYTTQAFY